jgi:hypothetical protein
LREALAGLPEHIHDVSARRETFNKSFAQNIGAANAAGETLLLLDTDVILEDDLFTLAGESLGQRAFLTVASVRESGHKQNGCYGEGLELAYITEISVPCGRTIRLETNRVKPHAGVRSGPGLIAVRRAHFLQVGGTNSALEGWGWEDLDLIARLQFELGLERVQAGRVLHLSHQDTARALGGRSRVESEQENYLTCLANYTAGLFQGSFHEDVRSWCESAQKETAT